MKNLYNGIYAGKKVLITGHTGFKGSWLALWLKELGAEICGIALDPPTNPSHYDLLHLDINSHIVDIRDREKVNKVFDEFKPEVVFHLAAQPLVRYSYKNPTETYETNVIGSLNIFEASRRVGTVKSIVCVTTDKCYENKEWHWGYRENDPMGGYDPYSSSKACLELMASSYRNSYFNHEDYGNKHITLLATARAGNVIGGGDWAVDRLIPDIVQATNRGESVLIRNPYATRPWQHVLEPLHGYLMLGQKLLEGKKEFAEAWNFGPNDDANMSVEMVLSCMKNFWKAIDYEVDICEKNPHEANLLMLDCSKAKNKLKWKPVLTPENAFKLTADWYQEYYNYKKIISKKNIEDFIDRIYSTE